MWGVNCEKFACSPRLPKAVGGVNILTIARFVRKKGIEYGVRAVAEVTSGAFDK